MSRVTGRAAIEESEHFVWWPALALIGFVVLVGVVIALGTRSTGRYEREQRARARARVRSSRPAATSIGTAATVPLWPAGRGPVPR